MCFQSLHPDHDSAYFKPKIAAVSEGYPRRSVGIVFLAKLISLQRCWRATAGSSLSAAVHWAALAESYTRLAGTNGLTARASPQLAISIAGGAGGPACLREAYTDRAEAS